MNTKISVIVAVHNDEKNIKTALDSIKNQSLREIEVIMIDACSTDNSKAILKSYCGDKRFSYYEIEENHFSVARNFGIEKAKGKYISFGDASVIFTKNFLKELFDCAERENAELCVAPMASSDIYGKHDFASTDILSRRKSTTRFDTDLIWNPAVTNKLFLKSKIEELSLSFKAYGKAREAAFSIPFAFESNTIACSSRGAAIYTIPVQNGGISEFPIEHYLQAYEYIIEKANRAFDAEIENCKTTFDKKETERLRVCYIDQVILKEITVLLYSYYRHFWSLEDDEISKYTSIISSLIEKLSKSGKTALYQKNKDIFYDKKLIASKAEMAENPRVTVCIGKSDFHGHLHEKRLRIQVSSIFNQTMPCFELLVDERLRDIFPAEWIDFPNVKFLSAGSLSDFKDLALESCKTGYIMFQDGFTRLNPKILMRHYCALVGREKYGFTTSPLTKFDGSKTTEYSFSDIAFFSDMNQTRTTQGDRMFPLDLFFCNKLFRTEHLNGIHFSFSDNPVYDMYKLYEHSRFKKLSHRGSYLPYSEEEALSFLREKQDKMPPECKRLYKTYKTVYQKKVTSVRRKEKLILFLKKYKRIVFAFLSQLVTSFFKRQKVKNRAFFYTIRSNGKLLENLDCVYKNTNCEKVVFAKMLPHSLKDIIKVKYYLLTSKVIVTDDYLKYLRQIRLHDDQKVVQVWHASGAFKRFGLDAPSRLTRIEEFKTHSQYTDVCVSSEYVRQFYAHAFGVDLEVVKALGSPRTDELLDSEKLSEKREDICARHPLLKNKRVYLYLPTFREDDGAVIDFEPKIDFEKLNDELLDDELFIVSRHPVMKNQFFKDKFYSRVKDYTFEPTSELLSVADVVITDYSSVIFDASIMNIPTVFYCPDYHGYERDFYLDYEKDLPGDIVVESEELLTKARAAFENPQTEKIKEFSKKQMSACNGNSTKTISKLIENYLK